MIATHAPAYILLVLLAGTRATAVRGQDAVDPDVPSERAAIGYAGPVVDYDLPDSPEGIAFDAHGAMYVGVRNGSSSRIDRITADGARAVFAELPDQQRGSPGVLGLVFGPDGTLFAAHPTGDPGTHGVYRIPREGDPERIAGSGAVVFPNALAFDARGNLYVTDSFGPASILEPGGGCTESARCGALWKLEPGGSFLLWLRHPLFDSAELAGAPIPVPGANGVAYYESEETGPALFVANSSMSMVVRIPVQNDGSPGPAEAYAGGFELATVDGLAVDSLGNVYGVMAGAGAEEAGAPPVPAVTRIRADGSLEAVVPFAVDTPFDAATSLAFGVGPRAHASVFVVNAALYGPLPNNPGPGVVEVRVGVPGFRIR